MKSLKKELRRFIIESGRPDEWYTVRGLPAMPYHSFVQWALEGWSE